MYTQADLDKVRQAKVDLATGERVTSVTFSNGKSIQYASADLQTLERLEAHIAAEVSSPEQTSFFRVTCSKGL